MHLGDHLFFLPVIKLLHDNNLQVYIKPTKIMVDFFYNLGFNIVIEEVNFKQYDIIISRIELISQLKIYRSLLIDVAKNLNQPICSNLLDSFRKYFIVNDYKDFNYQIKFANENFLDKYNLSKNKKIILFNLYCDSARYLITKNKLDLLVSKIKQYSNDSNYQLLFVGSKQDKLKDKNNYDFNFIDLRGKTSVIDIFEIVAYPNTIFYIGFDAFVMHVFNLNKKKSFVVFRGRINRIKSDMLKKYHVNLFKDDNYVNLLN
jgi:ADP-heptose:LPS heptosyltransferase